MTIPNLTSTHPLICTLLLAALGGCSDASADAATPVSEAEPLYVSTTRVWTGDDSQGYMYSFSSIDDGKIDLKKAIELDDAWVFGDAKPYFFTATIFSPEIKQWSLDDKGAFVPGPVVSFANEGVMGAYSAAFTPVYSAEKSYFVDSDSAQVVVWNPKAVELIKTIPIDVELPEDHAGPADLSPTVELEVQKDRLLVSVFWNSFESGWTEMGAFTRLIVIDTETDEVVSSAEDTRCASASPVGTTSDGTTYYTPYDYHVASRAVFGGEHGAASCALRVKGSEDGYDRAYDVNLSDLVGGRPAGEAFLVSDEEMLLHVWDESLSTATPENWSDDGRWQASYQWYRWTIGSHEATPLPGQEPSSEGGTWAKLDGRLFSYNVNPEYSETTLVELHDDGTTTPRLVVPGWTQATIRAR